MWTSAKHIFVLSVPITSESGIKESRLIQSKRILWFPKICLKYSYITYRQFLWLKGHDWHFVIVPLCYNLHMNGRSLLMWKSKRWVLRKNANMRNIFEFTQTEKVWDEAAYPLNISRVSSGTFPRKYNKKKQDMDTQGIQKVPGCFMKTHMEK